MQSNRSKALLFSTVLVLFFSAFAKAQSGTIVINDDPRIAQLFKIQTALVKDGKLKDRYKIQLYSGDATSANSTLKKFRNRIGTWSSDIKYQTPNYKVWVGNFRNRLEADRALMEIKKEFGSAFVFQPS